MSKKIEVVVIGSGPGGYTAAFRAADLGKKVLLIEKYENLGGVCLNVGCIPSKALLHTAQIINEANHADTLGVHFNKPKINLDEVRANKENIVKKLTGGIKMLAKGRKVETRVGFAKFIDATHLSVGDEVIEFEHCIIAVGSRVTKIPMFPFEDKRVLDSTDALELEDVPKKMLIVGGGIIGLEMATVYAALGSEITIVELADSLISAADKDVVKPLLNTLKKQYKDIYLKTKVVEMNALKDGIEVKFEGSKAPKVDLFDKVLVSIGRNPNGLSIDAQNAGVKVEDNGFINVDKQMRTNISNIFAIGDVVGQPMLAHKAVHEAKVAAEVICGHKAYFEPMTIPSVAYTDPEVAWTGKTETELKAENIAYEKGVFPWAASGRSLSIGRNEGMSKALFDKTTKRLLGMGMCGTNAGELIAEATLAIEMGADMSDISLTIHPHPTLSETVCFAAEMAEGTITDLLPPKKG
jgi:dihydrolipoamide dehydrogenase